MTSDVNPIRIEVAELTLILPLRTEVLRDGQPPESAWFVGDHDAATLHLAAFDARDNVIGCVSLMQTPMVEDPTYTHQLRGMAVEESVRNRGVGALLLAGLRRQTPEHHIWCNARVPAQRFYERHGWRATSEVFVTPHHGPHVRMVRNV